MLATTVEKDMPSNMKLNMEIGSRPMIQKPSPAESSSMAAITATELFRVCVRRRSSPVTSL